MKCFVRNFVAVVVLLACCMVGAGAVHATPSQGPDPADFTESNRYGNSYAGSGRTVDYAVATSAYNTILTTTLNIYMPASSGTITVNNKDICYGTYRAGGRNYDQLDDGTINSSGNAVSYRIGGNTQWGAFNGAGSCDAQSISFAVSGATLDPNTNTYKYQLVVNANPATDKYTNTFWVVAPAGSYISQDSSLPTSSFAMEQTSPIPAGDNPSNTQNPPNPYVDYSNYLLRFAPDCSLTTSGSIGKSIELYDDDNSGNWDVQPRPFLVKLIEIDNITNVQTNVPLNATFPDGFGGGSGPDGSGYYTFYTTANNKRMVINFNVQRGKRYQWIMDSVYYDNTLQIKLPYDSIYYYTGCALPDAQYKASMTSSPPTMSQEDTATFTPSVSVSNFRANNTVNCTITRTFYPAAGGSSSLGSQPCVDNSNNANIAVTGNGTITLKANTFSSPGTATPGSRVCDTITITSPSGSNYYTSPGDKTSTGCVTITKTPNVQFIGDVWAGGGFAAVAPGTCLNGAKITTVATSAPLSDGTRAGSGTTYAAFALDKITNFGSASFAQNGGSGTSWTFSNTNSSNLGFFNAGQHCIPDYVATYQSATALAPGTIDVGCSTAPCGGGGSGAWKITGDSTVNGTMIAGRQKVYYVIGNVTVNADIKYPASYASVADIPGLVVIATGNIYVNSTVRQIDGIYISRGTVYTCYPKTEPATIGTCNNQIVINGSVSASGLDLFRTAGADGTTPATRKAAAESFSLSPEVYITNALNTTSTGTITTNNVRELPPRF